MIEITSDEIERVNDLLAGIPGGTQRVFAKAMNRGLSRIKTQALRKTRTVYSVSNKALSDAARTKVTTASTGNLAGAVSFAGTKLPLYKFKVTPTEPATGKQVRAALLKGGSGTPFESAFIAEMESGHKGVFERSGEQSIKSRAAKYGTTNKHTEKIREIMGLSAAEMVGNQVVIEQLEVEAQEVVNERLIHEMNRILDGYGG